MEKINVHHVLTFLFLTIFLFSPAISYAVPAAPSPTCAISATVLDVQKTKTNIAGLGQPPREDFYYFLVKLKIKSSSVYQQEGYGLCDNLINKEQDSILYLAEYDKLPISMGQKINANIKFGGDEWFNGYFLSEIKLEDQPQISNIELKESVEYTTPGGISPSLFRGLQWLATILIIGAFIFKFRPHAFKVVFSLVFAVISLILFSSCFIVDVSLPKFCAYRELSLPVFIFADPLGNIIPTVAMRDIIMPIATPFIAFGIWYIIGSILFTLYNRIFKK